jgi:hypothetical protein
MNWRADTDQTSFDCGTVLSVSKTPWTGWEPPPVPPKGAKVAVRFTSGAPFQVEVIEHEKTGTIIVQTSDGAKWRIARRERKEVPLAANTDGAPTSYWIIQERVLT